MAFYFRFGMATLLWLLTIFVLVVSPVAAGEVSLRFQKDYRGSELAFLHTFCYLNERHSDLFMETWRDLSDLRVAFHDLNDDGADEMLVFLPVGGTAGEDFFVFQRQGGEWKVIGHDAFQSAWIAEEKVAGYRTLLSDDVGLRWDPARNQYWGICVSERCAEETGLPLTKVRK